MRRLALKRDEVREGGMPVKPSHMWPVHSVRGTVGRRKSRKPPGDRWFRSVPPGQGPEERRVKLANKCANRELVCERASLFPQRPQRLGWLGPLLVQRATHIRTTWPRHIAHLRLFLLLLSTSATSRAKSGRPTTAVNHSSKEVPSGWAVS
jgi:hypothetical protein